MAEKAFEFSNSEWPELASEVNKMFKQLPTAQSQQLRELVVAYEAAFGAIEMFNRLRGKNVVDLLAEFRCNPPASVTPLAEGELNGTRYKLYPATQNEQSAETKR